MAIIKQISVSAENTWSEKFNLSGDTDGFTPARRALVSQYGGADNTITIRRYSPADGTTIISAIEITDSMTDLSIPVEGLYDIGIATGNFGSGPCLITVEQ